MLSAMHRLYQVQYDDAVIASGPLTPATSAVALAVFISAAAGTDPIDEQSPTPATTVAAAAATQTWTGI